MVLIKKKLIYSIKELKEKEIKKKFNKIKNYIYSFFYFQNFQKEMDRNNDFISKMKI